MRRFEYDAAHPAFRYLSGIDPVLGRAISDVGAVSRPLDGEPFESLAKSIMGQQLSLKAADTIISRVEAHLGTLDADAVLAVDPDALRAAGLSRAKVAYLRDLSMRCRSGELDLSRLHALSDDEVVEQVTRVKGVGPWTADMFLIFALGREDVFSMGDGGLRRAAVLLYGDRAADDDVMRSIAQLWSPHRTAACFVLWELLGNA